jgi:predicted dehydrogenase
MRRQIEAGALGRLVNAEANITRDRLGQIDLTSWRYTAEGMPGGVMLQIGIHYTDVLAYLLGPIRAVSAQLAQLVLPGDNPDVASLILEHESGALATLNASYASAAEHHVMNVYGKEATAYYDLHQGLRWQRRGQPRADPVSHERVDAVVDELEEFAGAVRGLCAPEVGGEQATASLAVIRAGLISAGEQRRVEIGEIWRPPAERG